MGEPNDQDGMDWMPPKETDLTKEEGDPGDRADLGVERERVTHSLEFEISWKRISGKISNEAPASSPSGTVIPLGILAFVAAVTYVTAAAVATWISLPWWAAAGFAAVLASATIGAGVYLVIRLNRSE